MGYCSLFLLLCFPWSFLITGTHQLQSSQTQVLLQLRKHLEYPAHLEFWNNHGMDLCYLSPSTQVNMTCQDNVVTELRMTGDKPVKVNSFVGFAITNITLSGNFSMDSFVTTLARLTSLRVLSLVSLGIWGPLPDKIHRLSSLEYLDLSSNYLFGSVPPKISTMVKLQALNLDDNFFNDTVPDWFDSLSNLTILSLRNNQLKGPFPSSIQRVTTLTDLILSGNDISGKLPNLDRLSKLNMLDLSENSLDSDLPSMPKGLVMAFLNNNSLSGYRVVKFGGNCLSVDLHHQHAESSCIDVPVKRKHSGGKNMGVLVGVLAGLFFFVVLLAFGLVMVRKRYLSRGIPEQHLLHKAEQDKSVAGFSSEILSSARFVSEAAKLGIQGLPACRSFTLEELKEATNNFNDSSILGDGSYGKLYKGILENGTQVAIRCVPSSKKYSMRNLKLRMDLLAKLRHPHLVCLLGHCIDGGGQDDYRVNKVFLVYEYVSNGNFRAYLSEDRPGKVLNWSERLAVLISVAKAIHFLHTGVIPGFFNNRLKANNILLNEHGIAKLSDYGLSIISELAGNCGENGEGPKSWQMARLEDDVCSFGFILLESLVGPSVSSRRDKLALDELASCNSHEGRQKSLNPIVLATSSQESLSAVITITDKCICSESWSRPSFEDILWNLQYAVQVQATADGEQFL
ncbi:PREDICTED: probable inactive leucine-rich repeat receptor-like protein kinase At3g03770 isoform X2 [Populus euphratica]|uniref:Probable inactive leucine-rich repeat receptor-like protein kinase At3g03770 isoform X2 n=1 Tax=Populus euphratica TaxID=75702 RepID=A0AAJ6VAM5_POPEU|nr:PREDICTED: probable inactive leucine-rich repeat receptor-like protein kinase At3g03770 isoform X2 [Populus euphratica]